MNGIILFDVEDYVCFFPIQPLISIVCIFPDIQRFSCCLIASLGALHGQNWPAVFITLDQLQSQSERGVDSSAGRYSQVKPHYVCISFICMLKNIMWV